MQLIEDAVSCSRDAGLLSTGITGLDRAVGGLPIGLTVLAAPGGMGTTALATQIALHLGTDAAPGVDVLMFPVSSGAGEIATRYSTIAQRSDPRVCGEPPQLRTDGAWWGDVSRVWLVDRLAITTTELAGTARDWAAANSGERRLIIVDRLDGLAGVDLRRRRGGSAARTLRNLAIELDAAVLICARLPARVKRDDPSPRLSELNVYGSLLNAADLVGLLSRDGYYDLTAEDPTDTQLDLWSRGSGYRRAELRWDPVRLRFDEP